jgi:hypothetical protein
MNSSFKKILIAGLFLLFILPVSGFAQPPGSYSEGDEMIGRHPMMEPGMGHPGMEMEHPGMGQMWNQEHGDKKPHWMRPHNAAVHFLQMKDALGLSEKQVNDLKGLRDIYRNENTVNEAKLKSAEEELREILEEDSINLEKADAKLKEIGSLEGPIWSSFVKQLAKIKAIVPKEQMKKMHGMRWGHPMMERE